MFGLFFRAMVPGVYPRFLTVSTSILGSWNSQGTTVISRWRFPPQRSSQAEADLHLGRSGRCLWDHLPRTGGAAPSWTWEPPGFLQVDGRFNGWFNGWFNGDLMVIWWFPFRHDGLPSSSIDRWDFPQTTPSVYSETFWKAPVMIIWRVSENGGSPKPRVSILKLTHFGWFFLWYIMILSVPGGFAWLCTLKSKVICSFESREQHLPKGDWTCMSNMDYKLEETLFLDSFNVHGIKARIGWILKRCCDMGVLPGILKGKHSDLMFLAHQRGIVGNMAGKPPWCTLHSLNDISSTQGQRVPNLPTTCILHTVS